MSNWNAENCDLRFLLFLSAAKAGDPSAQHNFGYFYDVGVGGKANRKAAMHWYQQAFHHGYRVAANNIGTIFRDEKNVEQALLWFRRAVRLGDADANLEMAKIYLTVKDDIAKATACLNRVVKAKASDVTQASKDEARRLLRQLRKQPNFR